MSKDIETLKQLMTPFVDKEHMQLWLKEFLGFTLPDCKVTDYADSTPADFVWEVYRAIMDGTKLHTMALSGRDASKTVSLSIIDLLAMLHDERSAIHMGMTKAQANRAREYLEKYVNKNPLIRDAISKSNTTELKVQIGEEQVGLELIAMSPKAVQGGHAGLVSYDELASSIDPLHLKAYRDSSGIAGTTSKGKPAIIVKITSRQAGFSLAEQEIRNAKKSGIKIVKWTTIDCMKKCPDERSGTIPTPMHVNIIKGLKYSDEEWQNVPDNEKEDFKYVTGTFDKCHACPLAMYCQGAAKNQTSDSVLLRDIDDVITKVQQSGSHEWVLSQIMSGQPSLEGLVYHMFNPLIHIPGWDAMWTTLTREIPTKPVTRKQFIERLKLMGCTFIAGIDFGFTAPSTCVVCAIDRKENVYVVEAFGRVKTTDPDWVNMIKDNIHDKYDIQMYLPDTEDPGAIVLIKKEGLPVSTIDKKKGSVKEGINVVVGLMRVPGTNNMSRIFFAPDIISSYTNIPGLIDEFGLYKKATDASGAILDDQKPEKGNDHYLDALRYALYWYFGKAKAQAVFAGDDSNVQLDPNNLQIDVLAQVSGIKFNDNRQDFDAEGKPKKNPGDDDPDGAGGGGGGLQIAFT